MSIWIRYLVAGLLAGFSLNILAADIAPLQQRWAEIQYQLPEDQKADAFEALAAEAEQALAQEPDDAPLLIWRGIILSRPAPTAAWVRWARSRRPRACSNTPCELTRRPCRGRPTPVWVRSTIRCRAGRSALATTSRPRRC